MPDHVLRVQSVLTTRDHVLLEWLVDHGVLTTPQIAYALFPSRDFAQHRLTRLTALGVVDRFRPFRPDGGSFPYHYMIDQLGAEIVAAQRDQPPPRPGHAKANRRRWTASRIFDHRLGVNQFFTDLAGYARTHPGHALHRWWPESRCAQPGAFSDHSDPIAHATAPTIRPDGHGVWTDGVQTTPFFLEYDTGGEPLTTLIRKLVAYAHFATATGLSWPVLFWLRSADRERHLHQRIAETGGLPFPVATAARTLNNDVGPAVGRWWLHGHPGQLALADLDARSELPGLHAGSRSPRPPIPATQSKD